MVEKHKEQYAPDEVNKDGEYIKIGGSPMPGIVLRQVLKEDMGPIFRIAWSPDGRYVASPLGNNTIHIWEVESGRVVAVLKGGQANVISVAWSPDGKKLASISWDKQFIIWDVWTTKQIINSISIATLGLSVSWSPDGNFIAIGSYKDEIEIYETEKGALIAQLDQKSSSYDVAWSPDGELLASGSAHNGIFIWEFKTQQIRWNLTGHTSYIRNLSWLSDYHDRRIIASASKDNTIGIWDAEYGSQIAKLEGHTSQIHSVSFSKDGNFLASKSLDNTVRLWRTDTWDVFAIIHENGEGSNLSGLAFNPFRRNQLATLGSNNTLIRVWDLELDTLFGSVSAAETVRYITAKLVLVGDSGVGKTGLGWRLAHNEFKEHSSTHGQQFWVVPELKKTRDDGTECEAVLWDLAGQHIYRSIHSIFLDDVDASLVLFDPTNRQEPLKGAQFWLEQLKGKKQLPPTILVGARLDRGAPVLSQQELDQFCQEYGISGGYIGTSAKTGQGLDTLLETLKLQILWDQMTTTVTTVTFKRIKEYVLKLKEKPDRKGVLVRPDELRKQLEGTEKDRQFTDVEMMTAVGHLANHGYVTILKSSSGEEFILLVPKLLASVASSIFLHADKHPRELGAINETELLQGKYSVDEFKGLEKEEQQVLLDATMSRFLEHSVCFRETYENDNLLVFPSLIKQKRPLTDDVLVMDDISYIVRGRVENIYASLVVLLGYTSPFSRINQWTNQAQYETDKGIICGFRLIEDREGEIELILYYDNEMEQIERKAFQALFEQFLYKRDVKVTPFPLVTCPNGHRQERATVVKRLREGKKSIFCDECGAPTELPDLEGKRDDGFEVPDWLKREEAIARLRSLYETHLVKVKGYRRDWASPRCYISHVEEQKEIAGKLGHDLADAGVFIINDVSWVELSDNIIIIDSEAYRRAWESNAIPDDIKQIKPRLVENNRNGLVSINVSGSILEHTIEECKPGVFHDPTHYVVNLFDLVLNLYVIPLNHAGFIPLRKSLHMQWEQSLAQKKGKDMTTPLKVFISYSHKDEEFKDELVTMLAGLQRRGVIDAWQDRRIEEGDEWYQEIQDAMNKCELAILLVSANFIASSFIQDEELARLLKRRMEAGLRVVPIIVKPCMWQSEPALKGIQGLPRDGKPVITFSKDNGDRDQVWTDIAKAIEKRAK